MVPCCELLQSTLQTNQKRFDLNTLLTFSIIISQGNNKLKDYKYIHFGIALPSTGHLK